MKYPLEYITKLLPHAAKTFTFMIGILATVILVSHMFNLLGNAIGIGVFGGQVIYMVTVLIGASFLLAHAESAQASKESEKAKVDLGEF